MIILKSTQKSENMSNSSKSKLLLLFLALLSGTGETLAQQVVSGIYVGGHIRRNRPITISTLRNS